TTAGAKTYEAMRHTCEEFAQRNQVIFRETNNRIPKDNETAMNHLLTGYYGQSDLVVSSALHGCIIAVALGRKVVAVSGDKKIDAFMEAVGLGEWVLDISQVAQLDDYLCKLSKQKHPLHALQQIKEANEEVAKRVKKIAAERAD
ncbi:MAG: hypothetical protein KKG00_05635, partial [Bacteroidetes bacterium]|nr:hypothetical protein [Bacteroidota bacterium]